MKAKVNITNSIKSIWHIFRLDKREVYAVYFFSILASIVSLSLPLGIQSIVGFVMSGTLSTSIIVLVTLVVMGTFFNGFLQIKQMELIETIEQKLFVRYTLAYGDRIPNLDIEKLNQYHIPELVNRFFDLPILQKSLQKILIEFPAAIFQVIFGTLLLSLYHPLFIAFGIVLLFIVILILRFSSNPGFETSMETSDYKYKIAEWFQEISRGIKTFKYSRNSQLHIKNTDALTKGYLDAKTRHFKILKLQYWSLIVFKLLITAGMLIFGVILLINQEINIGQFIAADIVILAIIASVEKLIINLDLVYEVLTSIEKLSKITNAEVEESGAYIPEEESCKFNLRIEKLVYQYAGNDKSFSELNLDIPSGTWLNIYGDSGAGKSTLMRVLAGTYKNFKGKYLINDIPFWNYNLNWVRAQMAILLGQQEILKGSLWLNVTLNEPQFTHEKVMEISKIIGLDEFIQKSDFGFDINIDPTGRKLSRKVMQQILLCRALLADSKLYILEDAFLFLNPINKEMVINHLKSTNATVILTGIESRTYCDINLNLNDYSHE